MDGYCLDREWLVCRNIVQMFLLKHGLGIAFNLYEVFSFCYSRRFFDFWREHVLGSLLSLFVFGCSMEIVFLLKFWFFVLPWERMGGSKGMGANYKDFRVGWFETPCYICLCERHFVQLHSADLWAGFCADQISYTMWDFINFKQHGANWPESKPCPSLEGWDTCEHYVIRLKNEGMNGLKDWEGEPPNSVVGQVWHYHDGCLILLGDRCEQVRVYKVLESVFSHLCYICDTFGG